LCEQRLGEAGDSLLAIGVGGRDKGAEERVGLEGLGLELGVELAAEEPGVAGEFANLDIGAIGGFAGDAEAVVFEDFLVLAIELIAVAVAFADEGLAVGLAGKGIGGELAVVSAEAHGAAEFVDALEFAEFIDDAVGRGSIEFSGIGAGESADVAGVLDDHGLHAEADAEVGHALFAGVADGLEHAFDAARAEAAGHKDAVVFGEEFLAAGPDEVLGLDPLEIDLEAMGEGAVEEGFLEALVGVFVFDVLADEGDVDLIDGVLHAVEHVEPAGHVGGFCLEVEEVEDLLVEFLFGENEGDFVDAGDVGGGNDGVGIDIAEESDFSFEFLGEGALGAADEHVGLDADGAELLDAVLGGLGFEFLGGGDPGHEGEVNEDAVVAAELVAELADGFDKRKRFDVADGATDFDDDDIDAFGDFTGISFDFVGDVGDDLDGFAEVIAAAFAGDDALVDAAGGEVVGLGEGSVGEAFVVAEVEVGFRAIVGDEDLTVLERAHGAGIDIEVGIEFLHADAEAAAFEQAADGGGGDSLAQGGDDTAGDEDVLSHVEEDSPER